MTFSFDQETRDHLRTLRDEERFPEAYQLIVDKLEGGSTGSTPFPQTVELSRPSSESAQAA